MKMPTAKARNNLLSMGPKLKDLPSNTIWKMGDAHIVGIRALYPTLIHQLQAVAIRASKELNFARPIVEELVVCMRRTRCSLRLFNADINLLQHSLTSSILSSFDHLAPNRFITILPKHKPWITPHIKNLMKKRDKAYKLASQSR